MNRRHGKGFIFPLTFTLAVESAWTLETDQCSNPRQPLTHLSQVPSLFWAGLLFSHWVVSDSLWPHGLQHARPPCPSPTPRAYSNSCPSSRWCHPTISSSVIPFLRLLPSIFPSIRVFSNESALHIRWPKYWSFSLSISPSNEYSRLISFRMDWFDLLGVIHEPVYWNWYLTWR